MKNKKKYSADHYTYRVEWSEEDKVHFARCLEFPSLTAYGDSITRALKEIQVVVGAWIKWLQDEHKEIPEPFNSRKYKGNLTLRVSADVHKHVTLIAAEQNVSVNQYIASKIMS